MWGLRRNTGRNDFYKPPLSWSLYWMRITLKRNTCTRTIKKHRSWSLTSEDSYVIGIVTAMHCFKLEGNSNVYLHTITPGFGLPSDSAVKKKTPPAMQEMQVWFLVRKIPRKRAWQPSILAWRIPWTEEPGEVRSIVSQRVGHDWRDWTRMHACTHTHQDSLKRLEFELWKRF